MPPVASACERSAAVLEARRPKIAAMEEAPPGSAPESAAAGAPAEKAAHRAEDAIAAADARACQAQAESALLAERVTALEVAVLVRPTSDEAQRQAAEAATAAVAPVAARLERVEARPLGAASSAANTAVARIGGIGWDSRAVVLREPGKTVLPRAGVDPADASAMAPVTSRSGTGSSVQVAFVTVAALERARAQVRAAAVVFEGQPREAWLDHQRSLQESTLVRAVHRLAEYLGDAKEGPRLVVAKNLAAKVIRHGPRRVAFVRSEGVTWTTFCKENWPASLRDEAAAFAMGS